MKLTSIAVSAVPSDTGVFASGAARSAVGASAEAPAGGPLSPTSLPRIPKSLTENDWRWNPLIGSIVNVALPPSVNSGLEVDPIVSCALVIATDRVPLAARVIARLPEMSNIPPALMSTLQAVRENVPGAIVVGFVVELPQPVGLATMNVTGVVASAFSLSVTVAVTFSPLSPMKVSVPVAYSPYWPLGGRAVVHGRIGDQDADRVRVERPGRVVDAVRLLVRAAADEHAEPGGRERRRAAGAVARA